MAVEDEGKRLVYTGDTNMNNRIADFAKDADYFVADAGLLEKDKADPATHLTAEEVGKIAAHAGVKNLILSHIWPEYSEQEIINEASRFYSKPIMAEEMKVYEL
jgi:ribonuclease BN (tRNA processing enzyme)